MNKQSQNELFNFTNRFKFVYFFPCRYLINFLLDASLGMLLIYAGVRAVSAIVEWRQWDSLRFGEYGKAREQNPKISSGGQ